MKYILLLVGIMLWLPFKSVAQDLNKAEYLQAVKNATDDSSACVR